MGLAQTLHCELPTDEEPKDKIFQKYLIPFPGLIGQFVGKYVQCYQPIYWVYFFPSRGDEEMNDE